MEWTGISADQSAHLALYLGGLVGAYFAGYKVGALIRILFRMQSVL